MSATGGSIPQTLRNASFSPQNGGVEQASGRGFALVVFLQLAKILSGGGGYFETADNNQANNSHIHRVGWSMY